MIHNEVLFYRKKSTHAIKTRLRELVGTDEIRLNDRKYIDKLMAALDREHEVCIWHCIRMEIINSIVFFE